MKTNHFKGKDVYEHLKEARSKGAKATQEPHGTEISGPMNAATDSAKETTLLLLGLWILLSSLHLPSPLLFFSIFSLGWTLWKMGRSALLGWSRLTRLHRLIEQERFEIEHHRAQEKEELRAMYEQKGFSGQLLDQVVEVLASDNNRLLHVMLEEELGLSLESFEHPLKQALGAGIGTLLAASSIISAIWIDATWIIFTFPLSLFVTATLLSAKWEGNSLIKALIWNLAVATVAIGSLYLIAQT